MMSKKLFCYKRILIALFLLSIGLLSSSSNDEFRVNTLTHLDQMHPSIDADAEGSFVVTWVSEVSWDESAGLELTEIFARLFNKDGLPKGPEFQVNTIWQHFQDRPAVAMGREGNFAITWVSYIVEGQTSAGISARLFDKNGYPVTPEFQVNEYTASYQGEPDVAMDNEGNFVIAWQSWELDGDSFGIFARIFDQNGNPSGPEFQVNTYYENDQIHPAIAMDNEGNFIIVWASYGQDDDQTGIFAQRFNRYGSRLGYEFQVNISTSSWQEWPDIAVDEWGNFIICWHSHRGGADSYDILARTFGRSGIIKGPEIEVNTNSTDWQIFPVIKADNEGNFIVVWQSWNHEGNSFIISARQFDSHGTPQGSEFQINAINQGSKEVPDVIMFDENYYIVVWQSFEQNDSSWDIYGRIFKHQNDTLIKNDRFRMIKNEFEKISHFHYPFSPFTTSRCF